MKIKLILLAAAVALSAVMLSGCADWEDLDDEWEPGKSTDEKTQDADDTSKSSEEEISLEPDPAEDFEYEQYEDDSGTAIRITGCISSSKKVVIPEEIEGRPVREIGESSFKNNIEVASVTIPDGVTKIEYDAFYGCTGLTFVTIPGSVIEISGFAFSGCTGLTSVVIPDSVTWIGMAAFGGCTALTSVVIGNGVTEIGNSTFSGCTALTSVTVPDSVTEIGSYAFSDCTGLTDLTLPNSVTEIGISAFSNCPDLTIQCPSGSTAEQYAIENEIPYTLI